MFITMGLAIVMTFMIQYALILLWRHIINRRYYIRQRAVAAAIDANDLPAYEAATSKEKTLERFFCGLFGPKKLLSPPKFVPYPKSLVWPTPLFFTCCIFVTGLTRNSVKLLCTDLPECGASCTVLPIVVLTTLVSLLLLTIRDLFEFRKKHSDGISWKPGAKIPEAGKVGDPYMRLRAKIRVQLITYRIIAADRASIVSDAVTPSNIGSIRRASIFGRARPSARVMPVPASCISSDADADGSRRSRTAMVDDTGSAGVVGAPPPPSPPPAQWVQAKLPFENGDGEKKAPPNGESARPHSPEQAIRSATLSAKAAEARALRPNGDVRPEAEVAIRSATLSAKLAEEAALKEIEAAKAKVKKQEVAVVGARPEDAGGGVVALTVEAPYTPPACKNPALARALSRPRWDRREGPPPLVSSLSGGFLKHPITPPPSPPPGIPAPKPYETTIPEWLSPRKTVMQGLCTEEEDDAAIILQTEWRCRAARVELEKRRKAADAVGEMNAAATAIQGLYRQKKARDTIGAARLAAKRLAAAKKIQKHARNRNARTKLRPWLLVVKRRASVARVADKVVARDQREGCRSDWPTPCELCDRRGGSIVRAPSA